MLDSAVVFEMSPYAPVALGKGDSVSDSVYFDGAMDRGFHAVGQQSGRILSACFAGPGAGPLSPSSE